MLDDNPRTGTRQCRRPAAARTATLPVEDLIQAVVTLRMVHGRFRRTRYGPRLAEVEANLATALPAAVTRPAAARALGVTPQALARWVDRGDIPTVPGDPRALPLPFLMELLELTTLLRLAGQRDRVLASALRRLRHRRHG